MAVATPITRRTADKSPDLAAPSPIMQAFSQLMVALARFIEAERDLEQFDTRDDASAHWLRSAELAHTDVTGLIFRIRNAAPARAADRALQQVATLIDMMTGSEEPGTFQRLHCSLPKIEGLFRYPRPGPVAQRVDALLRTARGRIDDLATLPSFIDPLMAADDTSRAWDMARAEDSALSLI